MVDAMRSPAPGRELVRLGRRGGRLPMPGASVSGRRGEAQARWRPAPPAVRAGAAQACQIAHPDARDRGISHLTRERCVQRLLDSSRRRPRGCVLRASPAPARRVRLLGSSEASRAIASATADVGLLDDLGETPLLRVPREEGLGRRVTSTGLPAARYSGVLLGEAVCNRSGSASKASGRNRMSAFRCAMRASAGVTDATCTRGPGRTPQSASSPDENPENKWS